LPVESDSIFRFFESMWLKFAFSEVPQMEITPDAGLPDIAMTS